MLCGQYREHFLDGSSKMRKPWRPWAPWRIIVRHAATAHRVELLPAATGSGEMPVWTIFLTGPRVREWGFHCKGGWRHWREFLNRDYGKPVRGCD